MAQLCIPKIQATKLINSLKGDGLDRILNMTSEERRTFFSENIGKDMGQKVNASFEKAIAAKRKSALIEFANNIIGKKAVNEKNIIQRINKLEDKGLLDGNILEDHISEFLGAKISKEEVGIIKKLGEKTNQAKIKFDKEFNNVQNKGEFTKEFQDSLIEYGKALKETDEFLLKQSGTDWSSTIWNNNKAAMLFNPASWNVNIISNMIQGVNTALERRIKNMRFSGYSSDLAKDWRKTMIRVRKETGYDLSRALSLDEMLQKNVIGEKMEIGKDNFFTKFVYDTALGGPDAWAGRLAFADALDLETASLVHGMGLSGETAKKKAREIFLDATNVVPKTEEGRLARQNAVLEAQIATWTQPGVLANATLKLKEGLNKMVEESWGLKGFKLGDMIEAFVKTPANIAQFGLDASGVSIVRGAAKFTSLIKNHKLLTEVQRKRLLGEALRDSMKTGLGVGGALALASFIPEENFVGAYDPNRHKYEQLKNSNYNSIRIGNKWYNLDVAGGFTTPLIAVLNAKKYGKDNLASKLGQYAIGVADQSSNIPFVGSLKDMAVKYNQNIDPDNPDAAKKGKELIYSIFNDQITSRVPGLVINISKLFDDKDREAKGFWQTLQSKLPGVRSGLPSKQDILGQEIMTEMGAAQTPKDKFIATITQLLAGARIKTAKDTEYGKEIIRLKEAGTPVSLTSWKYRLGERQERLKAKVGEEKYREIYREEYGKALIGKIESELSKPGYKNKSDKDKKASLDKLNDQVMDRIYSKYGIPLKK